VSNLIKKLHCTTKIEKEFQEFKKVMKPLQGRITSALIQFSSFPHILNN